MSEPEPFTDAERADMKRWVEMWKRTGPLLEEQREEDVRRCSTEAAIGALTGCFLDARHRFPIRADSGMVEQQRLFMLSRVSRGS